MRSDNATKRFAVSNSSVFTFIGFAIVILGWAILLVGLLVSDATLQVGSLVATMSLRADLITIAQTAIVSGFALAIIGALRSGFGAFTRFFDAVLQRSAAPRPVPISEPAGPDASTAPTVSVPLRSREEAPPARRTKDHNYVVLPDGSVEVETMFGTRVFATLDEAREFIR